MFSVPSQFLASGSLFDVLAVLDVLAVVAGAWQILAMGAPVVEAVAAPVVGARLLLLFFEG